MPYLRHVLLLSQRRPELSERSGVWSNGLYMLDGRGALNKSFSREGEQLAAGGASCLHYFPKMN
jgi:hypothetical protein